MVRVASYEQPLPPILVTGKIVPGTVFEGETVLDCHVDELMTRCGKNKYWRERFENLDVIVPPGQGRNFN